MSTKILEADHHRNGVSGVGFTVALFTDSENPGQTFLGISFESDDEGMPVDQRNIGCVAVVDVNKAAAGNIYMYPENGQPGDNAWRGNDYYHETMREAYQMVSDRLDAKLAEWVASK
jgi:hypothetical protein